MTRSLSGQLTAVIAGGGIGGLATAAALARGGVAVVVFERAVRVTDSGSGLVLYPNGVAAAAAISAGLSDRIRAAGRAAGPHEARLLINASGRVLAREPIGALARRYGLPQIAILRTELHEALRDEAVTAGAQLRFGLTVEDYAQRADSVSVRLADGSTHRCDLLLGADGIRSAVRQRMLGDGPPQYRGYTSVRGQTRGSWVRPQWFVANGRGVQLFVAPVAADAQYWTAKITAPPGVWPAKGPAGAHRGLAGALAGWDEKVVRLIGEADPGRITVSDIYDREPVPRWVDGRVALLGDAAHPMTPALGQGANMALEDAVVLADTLCAYGWSDARAGAGQALRAYQAQRTRRTAQVVLLSRRQGAVDQGAGHLRSLARNAAVRLRGRKDAALPDVIAWTAPGLRTTQATKV